MATLKVGEVGASALAVAHLVMAGQLSLAEGRLEEAANTVTEALELCKNTSDLQLLREAHAVLAECDLLRGQPAAAQAHLLPLLNPDALDQISAIPLFHLLAWAQLELGQITLAEQTISSAIDRMRANDMRCLLPDALRVRATIALRRSQRELAEEALQEAISVAEAVQYPLGQARAAYLAGTAAAEYGKLDDARAYLRMAHDLFARLGVHDERDRASAALAALPALP